MTNQTKHTAGPWTLRGKLTVAVIRHPKDHIVCNVRNEITGFEPAGERAEQEANARLIAAAPELLEALKKLHESLPTDLTDGQCHAACIKAKKAISRAEGGL